MAYGKGNLGGKSKLKFWETDLDFTHVLLENNLGGYSVNFNYAYKNVKVVQNPSSTYIKIYYKNILMKEIDILVSLFYEYGHIIITEEENIYIRTETYFYTFLKSENYNIRHDFYSPATYPICNVNFEFNDNLYFISQKTIDGSYRMVLFKFPIPENKIISQNPVELNLQIGSTSLISFFISNGFGYYCDNTKINNTIIYKVDLINMVKTSININISSFSVVNYLGYYNNKHYLYAKNDSDNRLYYLMYNFAGGSIVENNTINLDNEKFKNTLFKPNLYLTALNKSVQVNERIVAMNFGTNNSYNNALGYFDFETKSIVKYISESNTTLPLIGTLNKVVGYNTNSFKTGVFQQFYIE